MICHKLEFEVLISHFSEVEKSNVDFWVWQY